MSVQKPVAWLVEFENGEQELHFNEQSAGETHTPLYTHPAPAAQQEPDELTIAYMSGLYDGKKHAKQREWVGLTEEEMHECAGEYPWTPTGLKCARAIEAKLKAKNHG